MKYFKKVWIIGVVAVASLVMSQYDTFLAALAVGILVAIFGGAVGGAVDWYITNRKQT